VSIDPDAPEFLDEPEEKTVEPIYPTGPALRVASEQVELTFLDREAVRERYARAGEDTEPEEADLEIRTPIGVRIPVFEGPLDLLLFLIRRDKLDIYDIPIGHITEQYLGMLGVMQVLDLEVAGDFLVMAATLMRIKARMLLPSWPEDEEDEEDPRGELVRQLLEYRKFKEAAKDLHGREEDRRRLFGRGFIPEFEVDLPPDLEPVSQFALIEAIKDVLARVGEEFFYQVELEDVTLEEKIELILSELAGTGRVLFADLMLRHPRRMHVVVTFMAMLELAKQGVLTVAQEAAFGQIWVYRIEEGRVSGEVDPDASATEPEAAAPDRAAAPAGPGAPAADPEAAAAAPDVPEEAPLARLEAPEDAPPGPSPEPQPEDPHGTH